jgi:hypothetical protein
MAATVKEEEPLAAQEHEELEGLKKTLLELRPKGKLGDDCLAVCMFGSIEVRLSVGRSLGMRVFEEPDTPRRVLDEPDAALDTRVGKNSEPIVSSSTPILRSLPGFVLAARTRATRSGQGSWAHIDWITGGDQLRRDLQAGRLPNRRALELLGAVM